MIIYEENFIVENSIKIEFAGFLTAYLENISKIKGFQYGTWFFNNSPKNSNTTEWVIQFTVDNIETLNNFKESEYKKYQNEAKSKFEDKFDYSNRILNLLGIYGLPENMQLSN